MYFVYALKNPKGVLYKGSTGNLGIRFSQHKANQLPSYTKNRGPWTVVHIEGFKTKKEATAREKFLKTGKGREELGKILSSSSSRNASETRSHSAE